MRLLWGEVLNVDDEETRGRIQVSVPNLGRVTQDKAIYAYPIDVHALRVPRVGDRVMLMFVAGRPSQAIYLGQARWLDESPPSTYEGPDTVVLYEDPDGGLSVVFDVASGMLNIKDGHGTSIVIDSAGVTMETSVIDISVSGDISISSGGDVTVDVDGDVLLDAGGDADMIATGTATLKGANAVVEGSLFVTLKSGDAAIWMPNVLPVDPLTGMPHGGPTAGIIKLKGA